MAGRTAGGAPRVVGGAGGAWIVVADGTSPPWRPGVFDRVLADVPCSGLGALRRRPEARWRRRPRDIAGLGALQRRLLVAALASLRPGGVAAYVTCSPHLDETRRVVEEVVSDMAGPARATVLDAPAVLAGVWADSGAGVAVRHAPDGIRCPPGQYGLPGTAGPGPGARGAYAQFWPHRHGTDAIFLALLRRDA